MKNALKHLSPKDAKEAINETHLKEWKRKSKLKEIIMAEHESLNQQKQKYLNHLHSDLSGITNDNYNNKITNHLVQISKNGANYYLNAKLLTILIQAKNHQAHFYYHRDDEQKLATSKMSSTSFVYLKALLGIRFVKVSKTYNLGNHKLKIQAQLTPIGEAYLKRVPSSLKSSKLITLYYFLSKHPCAENTMMWIAVILLFILSAIPANGWSVLLTLFVDTPAFCVLFDIDINISLNKNHSYPHGIQEIINSMIQKKLFKTNLTKQNFENFLNQHHVREPNIAFNYTGKYPKISDALFTKSQK